MIMSVYAVPNDKPFIANTPKTKRKKSQIDYNAELLRNPNVQFEIVDGVLQICKIAEKD